MSSPLFSYAVEDAKETKQPQAFKITHQSLLTYVFAAETDQEMSVWVKVLTLASMGRYPETGTRTPLPVAPISLPTPSTAPPPLPNKGLPSFPRGMMAPAPGSAPKLGPKPSAGGSGGVQLPRPQPPLSPPPTSAAAPAPAARPGKPLPKPKPLAPPPKPAGEPMVAQYDCEPGNPDELSFEEGDTLYIVDKSDPSWWKAVRKDGKEGLVPSNYF